MIVQILGGSKEKELRTKITMKGSGRKFALKLWIIAVKDLD